ncbi:unnamed protein product [Parnassius apollo]|uniref:(apollo) hypothetical protein n=1 Tax=Parnassius apollo TaxID=110799 RepID=A0A8S3Y2R9_PARAO|nr:unnamed protein product [Parnassius apollo]
MAISKMPPRTSAEKQKKYRDKLKKENPQKYEEIQKKAKERSARYYEKKRVPILKSTNKNYGINGRLKQETAQLRLQLNTLTKDFKSVQKKTNRQQKNIDKMQADYENLY